MKLIMLFILLGIVFIVGCSKQVELPEITTTTSTITTTSSTSTTITIQCIERKIFNKDGLYTTYCYEVPKDNYEDVDDSLYCTKLGNMYCPSSMNCTYINNNSQVGVCKT